MNNSFEDRKHKTSEQRLFKENEFSALQFTDAGGGEHSFRLVQEKYCGWLQRQIADIQLHKVAGSK